MPVTLSLGRGHRPLVGCLFAGQCLGEHLAHLVEGRDEPVAGAAMLGAFPERKDVWIVGAHLVVDDDARD